jgi:uncharacterized protein (DUF1684 family)
MTDAHDHGHRHVMSYEDAVAQYRADKDDYFRTSPGSPIPASEREAFTGLPFFAVDPAWVVDDIALEPYTGSEPVRFEIPTTDGKLRPAERAGVLAFELGGAELRLTAYRFAGTNDTNLFVPFLDATSGTESYGAGRYLDVDLDDDGTVTLDFNMAYHPSCVYDPKFSCPITPAENRLSIRVEAGERLAETHAPG